MSKYLYDIVVHDGCHVVFEVDMDKVSIEELHERNNFYTGNEERLTEFNGDVIKAFLSLVAEFCFEEGGIGDVCLDWIINTVSKIDAMPDLIGECGITLKRVDSIDYIIEDDDIDITEIE